MKSDNPELIGKHAFEAAGLGKPPYRFMGITQEVFSNGDGTTKPGGCCKYCFTGIMWAFWLKSADGNGFCVGSECINRSGDKGLIEAYKSSPEYRAIQAEKRAALDARKTSELQDLLNDEAVCARLSMCASPTREEKGETGLDYATWMMANSGAAGRSSLLKWIKTTLQGEGPSQADAELLQARITERREAEAEAAARKTARETLEAKRAEILAPLAAVMDDGRGGFCQSIAADLRRGIVPTGRGLDLMIEILAKRCGRMGSRNYHREVDRVMDITEAALRLAGDGENHG